jgi:hypothetical protein
MLPRVSLAFFMFAALCGVTGMGWGIYMGIAQDHSSFPAHAHLNLLGWVTMSLMGGFYALAKERISGPMPWVNLWLSAAGVALMIPSLTAKIAGVHERWVELGIALGAFANFFGMLWFAGTVAVVLLDSAGREQRKRTA